MELWPAVTKYKEVANRAKCWFIYTFQHMPNACTVLYSPGGEERRVGGERANHVMKNMPCKIHTVGLHI